MVSTKPVIQYQQQLVNGFVFHFKELVVEN